MPLPPLDERAIQCLQKELEHLQTTYKECAEIFSPNISPNGVKALDRINDAMNAISNEIRERGSS